MANKYGLKLRTRADARAQARLMAQAERKTFWELSAELTRAIQAAAAAFPAWERTMVAHERRLRWVLEHAGVSASLAAARRVRVLAKSWAPHLEVKADTSDQLRQRAVAWAKKRAASRAAEISNTTRRRIANAVARGIDQNLDQRAIAREIVDEVGGMTRARAEAIARTETHTASMTGQHDSMAETSDELGMKLEKTWVASEDARTRESHLEADGQTVPMDETFTVGGAELMFPGDENGPPEEIINCRCVVTYAPA